MYGFHDIDEIWMCTLLKISRANRDGIRSKDSREGTKVWNSDGVKVSTRSLNILFNWNDASADK